MNQPSANIHPEAKIGKNVIIEPFATIGQDVVIGDGTWVGPNAVIMDGARIGRNCRIFPGAIVSAIPQDLKYEGEDSILIVGDNSTIREFCTVNRGTKTTGKTVIGNNTLLMAYVHVAHDCVIGNHCVLVNGTTLGGEVYVDDWAIVSALTLVHQFCSVGKHVMISGGSKMGRDVPPYVTAAREPLSYYGVNSVGLTRRNFSREKITEIQDMYRIIFQKGLNTSNAVEKVKKSFPESEEKSEILNFIRNSRRGLIKGFSVEDQVDIG
jgi:UDP-N-acetylglucosamine acyltransferase